jgi:hypothetical protein
MMLISKYNSVVENTSNISSSESIQDDRRKQERWVRQFSLWYIDNILYLFHTSDYLFLGFCECLIYRIYDSLDLMPLYLSICLDNAIGEDIIML